MQVLSAADERRLIGELVETRKSLIRATIALAESRGEEPPPAEDFHKMIRSIRECGLGSDAADDEVQHLVSKYEETRDRIALANVRLVAYAARRYLNRGISFSDLLQEGFCGLLIGIDRFEPANGTRLATYALWWIKQALRRTISADAYPVRLNPKLLRQVAVEQEDLAHGPHAAKPHVTATLKSIRCAIRPTVSLDLAVDSGVSSTLADKSSSPTNRDRDSLENGEYVGHMMQSLSPREQTILQLRFGLDGKPTHSLSQISELLDVSKERIRQIQEKALQKLRAYEGSASPTRGRSIDTSGQSVRIKL
ncbi:MAG: hypothetical protein ABS79_05410 [Planctomycetes bacterium SCN 63-9]|nr:MAG: hypothetical protein ABS79_05410 [Planctomycetes bacterium SCN 63-9]